jgi:hypothetical protein
MINYMLKVSNVSVMNFENAIRGMRNPLNSWGKSDSYSTCNFYGEVIFELGEEDKKLALNLIKAGTDHRKFLRQIFVSMDIEAPLYWWKEMDQYKTGTTTNSCSTMHTITKKPFTIDMFSVDTNDLRNYYIDWIIPQLEKYRKLYLETNDKDYWRNIIQLLPTSFNQLRTWTGNYEVLRNIYHARKEHKLTEWHEFCAEIEKLPYSEFITKC